jgi:signal transduction histidine kinase
MTRDPGKHSTRLSVLFVAAILIPGCILAYFSIQNARSQKELAEKRLLEEEDRLATELRVFLQDALLRSAAAFFSAADKVYPNLQNVALSSDVGSYVAQAFALDNAGSFLWPRYTGTDALSNAAPESEQFLTEFSRAEKAELAEKNLGEAARLYRTAQKAAGHDAKRAAAINGLARVLAKSSQRGQAVAQYEILLERYASVQDDNGISFARYALHQLMQISIHDPEALSRRISTFLSSLESGKTPLTDQTEPLLREVEEWLDRNPVAAPNGLIRQQIGLLRQWLSFVTRDARLIDFLQPNHPGASSSIALGPFEAVAGRVEDGSSLSVIRRDAMRPEIVGFQVALEPLRRALFEHASHVVTSPAMEVSIAANVEVDAAGDSAALVRDLSPFLPEWRVTVRPQDPEFISRYVSRQRWIYGTTLALLVAGMILGVVLVLRDLSRERRLSQLRTDFVANITHELKTPLTSIRMFAETLRLGRARNEAEQQECLDVIVGETQRLSRLINTVLDFSKIERGQKQYRMAEVNVSEVAQSTLNTLRYSLEEQGFALEAEIEPGVRAFGDADALEQAMLNLIDNAVKYSQRNKSVRTGLWARDDRIFFRVTDKGIGIPEADQSRIFEKFYRGHAETGRDTGGAGLGLTVVKHIVEAHQGKIEVESKLGEGSSFTIILPKFQESAPAGANRNDHDPRD